MGLSLKNCPDSIRKSLNTLLPKTFSRTLSYIVSLLSWFKSAPRPVDFEKSIVWLFDNTAYRCISPGSLLQQGPWQVEVIACVFQKTDDNEIGEFIATAIDLIGLDGEIGVDEEIRRRIAQRLRPFLAHVMPGSLAVIEIPLQNSLPLVYTIGPSDQSGIISQVVHVGDELVGDATSIQPYLQNNHAVSMNTVFSAPDGWLILSDIDDTIKVTRTYEQLGMLQSTFAEEPQEVDGMPEFYSRIQKELFPTWFYLSASPYNLYPFLREFLHVHYPEGTMILRDSSWTDPSSLFKSLTESTQEYKVDRTEKIHGWFPHRRVVCIGDSTQRDPEAYAEIYRRHPGWVQAILIRKVTGSANMEDRNTEERFMKAFKDIPNNKWKVFEQPDELYGLLQELGTRNGTRLLTSFG